MGMLHFAVPPSVMTDHVLPVLHVCHEISSWPNSWTSDPSWTILLEFGLINDVLLYVTGHRWCRSLAKVTKRVPIEKSKLFFGIPKTISVIPYPYNFLVSYPLSLKLFCQLSLIPKTPNRASWTGMSLIYKLLFLKSSKLTTLGEQRKIMLSNSSR